MILASSRLILLGAMALMQPGRADARQTPDEGLPSSSSLPQAMRMWDGPWDAHAAAAVLDASFDTSDACQASLARAMAAESTPSADIDPRLRDLFTHARCTPVSGEEGVTYAMRLHWPRGEEAG